MENVNEVTGNLNKDFHALYDEMVKEIEKVERLEITETAILEQCFAIVDKYRNNRFQTGMFVNPSLARLKLSIDSLSEYYVMRYKAALFKPSDEMQFYFYCVREIEMTQSLFEKNRDIYLAMVSGEVITAGSMNPLNAKIIAGIKYREYLQGELDKYACNTTRKSTELNSLPNVVDQHSAVEEFEKAGSKALFVQAGSPRAADNVFSSLLAAAIYTLQAISFKPQAQS